MTFLIPFFAGALICVGLLFFLGTTVGLIRFPDFYTRMHAAGKGDTLSSMLILLGCSLLAIDNGHLDYALVLVGIKVLIIMNFIFIGSPTATHAMMDAGYETGVKHWVREKKEDKG
jgi:multicomponent Na+:H+ antiporter subunit G